MTSYQALLNTFQTFAYKILLMVVLQKDEISEINVSEFRSNILFI